MPPSTPIDAQIIEHIRAIAELAEVDASAAQLEAIAPQLLMLLRRFPAPTISVDLGQTEPSFGLRVGRA
jgi:hypothetical protein